jgi:hypothetical protein
LQKIFRFQAPPSTRLIVAGAEPRLLGSPAKNWSEVEKFLSQWNCWAPNAAIESAMTLASEIGKGQANILVLTDHAPADEKLNNTRLQWRGFGMPVANLAIVNASRTANGDTDRCLLEIANFSKTSHTGRLLVGTGSNAVQQSSISLAPGEQQRLVFNVPKATATLEAALETDALPDDNRVQLLPPIRKRIRVQVALTNSALSDLVERTLTATGLRAAISDNPELIIHHSDSAPGSNAWSLRWEIADQASAFTGPFIVDTSHPLAQGIGLEGVVWAAGPTTNEPGEVPVILAGNVPLLSVREDLMGRRFLRLNLNPELSTLQTTPDWPILLWNILELRATQIPGLQESNARLGTEVLLKTTGEPVTVVWPDHSVKSFAQTRDQLALETPLPGIYTVTMGTATNSFAVNPLAAEESNLQTCTTRQWGQWQGESEHRYEQSLMTWVFALGALAILTAHLWLLATGKGGS